MFQVSKTIRTTCPKKGRDEGVGVWADHVAGGEHFGRKVVDGNVPAERS